MKVTPKEIVPVKKTKSKAKRFRNEKPRGRYEQLLSHEFIDEMQVEGDRFDKEGILGLIESNCLEQLFCHTTIYVPDIVREFYAKWNPSTTSPSLKWYNKVWVRGHAYNFSPEAINYYLHYEGGDNVVVE